MAEKDQGGLGESGAREKNRGRSADTPAEIPKAGWKEILVRTKRDIRHDHLTVVAGGVAFFLLLAIIPGLAALISIYGLVADPAQVQQQFESLRRAVPGEVYQILNEQMQRIASSSTAAGWGAVVSIALALWGGSKGMKALMEGLNIMYEEEEKRGFVKLNLTSLALTVVGVIGFVVMIALIAAFPAVIKSFGLPDSTETWISYVRWAVLLAFFILGLGVLYRFAPSRENPKWKWVSWGAVVATVLWISVSILFSIYAANFGSYNKTYGSLGAIVVLMLWLYISAYAVLVGGELNSEMELQTARDTTTGTPEPQGKRGAYVADHVG